MSKTGAADLYVIEDHICFIYSMFVPHPSSIEFEFWTPVLARS
jgi:hypothetical protein